MNLIGFDFSINKSAACVFHNNEYIFYGWPYNLKQEFSNLFNESGVNIIERTDDKEKGDNISMKMRYEIKNSVYLAKLITSSLQFYLNRNTYLAFEGLSYASSGDVVLQLSSYKYMLMNELSQYIPLENMFTYSPITVKSTAGCAKKGMGKMEMINTFISNHEIDAVFRFNLLNKSEQFQIIGKRNKKMSWIPLVDDLVDAYFVLQTLKKKESI